jgi:polar amino acid transport system substrate-binding protein
MAKGAMDGSLPVMFCETLLPGNTPIKRWKEHCAIGRLHMYKSICLALLFIATGLGGALAQSPEAVKDLAPAGRLRAAINAGNVVLVQKDPASGEPSGITVDLARELGKRLGVPVDLVVFETAGKTTDAVKTGAWDVCFLAIEPVRAALIGFTAPYVIIEGTYMVGADSPLKDVADVDRDGVRIAVARGSAYDLYLTRTLKHATLMRYPSPPLALAGFLVDKLDTAAGVKQQLVQFAKTTPNMRVMEGHFQDIREAMGAPLGRDTGLQYLRTFVEEMKAGGFVRRSLDRAYQEDAVIAPPEKK